MAVSVPSYAVSPENNSLLGSWLAQKAMTGEWGGARNKLANKGVDLSANYTTDIVGNPAGGLRKGVNYAGFLQASAAIDFNKLASLAGWALTVSNYLASGRNLSNEIGNFFGPQQIYVPGDYYFGQLDLSYTFPGDKLILEGGRLFAGDVFATLGLWQYYVSGGINGNLVSISTNTFFPNFQIATWGVRATYEPDKHWKFSAAAYNANPKVADTFRHGLDFNFSTDHGCLGITQLTYKHHQERNSGLPGSATLGGYYNSDTFAGVAEPTRKWSGNYGVYFIIDQMIFRGEWPSFSGPAHLSSEARYSEKVKHAYYRQVVSPVDRPVGLSVWSAVYAAPQEKINTEVYQFAGGLVYQGMFPNRDRDVTAFCVLYGRFSDKLLGQEAETVLEFNHRFQVGQWCYITPDFQYIFNLNGQHNIDNAVVLGVEASFNF
ncbi:MAG: carbohydrate porin [Candidatus Omnitrophica bacterium]|nr:carbohydrate porin [Candidatus Omnitrophota bacterium]